MKIVLLPGMDGTGELFEAFRSLLHTPSMIIPLPQSGPQDYEFLAGYVESQLPDEDFIIVAESFSGPIAALLASKTLRHMKGIVFIATFLTCPRPFTTFIAKLLPLKSLLAVSFLKPVVSRLLLRSFNYSQFLSVVNGMSDDILKARLAAIYDLNMLSVQTEIRSLYLRAVSDYLVPKNQVTFFEKSFSGIQVEYLQGTHFLLQSNPDVCADLIQKWMLAAER